MKNRKKLLKILQKRKETNERQLKEILKSSNNNHSFNFAILSLIGHIKEIESIIDIVKSLKKE